MNQDKPLYSCHSCGATSYRHVIARNKDGAMRPSGQYRCTVCSVEFTDPKTWRDGARCAVAPANRGAIERGQLADRVLDDGDPTTRIEDIRRSNPVFRGGVACAPAEMHEALGVRPFVQTPASEKAAAK